MHSNDEGMGESVGGEGAEQCLTRALGVEAVEALTNEALLVGTRRLVCQSNRVLAALLAHLAEVEARGLHRTRACASLYIYCIYELRMSEDAAYRRVVAARLVKRFPTLFGAVERGELHVTALVLLAPDRRRAPSRPLATADATATVEAPATISSCTESANARSQALSEPSRAERSAFPPTIALDNGSESPRQRDRYVPAAVRRAVFERDGNRCAYVDARGERCRETSRLEFHHHEPFARGGPSIAANLSLYCAAHNALAAETDFGAELAMVKRNEYAHFTERIVSQADRSR